MLINRDKFRNEPTSFFKDIKIINVLLGYIMPEEESANLVVRPDCVLLFFSNEGKLVLTTLLGISDR